MASITQETIHQQAKQGMAIVKSLEITEEQKALLYNAIGYVYHVATTGLHIYECNEKQIRSALSFVDGEDDGQKKQTNN